MKNENQVLAIGTVLMPCTVDAMNLRQYVKVATVVGKKEVKPNDWQSLFEFLGAKKAELDDMEVDEFANKVAEFVKLMNASKPSTDLSIEDIETEKRNYSVELNEEGKIRISNSLRKLGEKHIKGEEGSIWACAIFYQDTENDKTTNQSEGAIKFRHEIFAKMPAIKFIPFLGILMSRYAEIAESRIKALEEKQEEDAPTEETTK